MTDFAASATDKTASLMQTLLSLQLRTPEQKPMPSALSPEPIDSPKLDDLPPLAGKEVVRKFRRKSLHPYRSAIACDLFKVMRPTIFGLMTEGGHDSDVVPTADMTRKRSGLMQSSKPKRLRRKDLSSLQAVDPDASAVAAVVNLANQAQARRARRPPERFRFPTGSSSDTEEEQENPAFSDAHSSEDIIDVQPLAPQRKASDVSETTDPVRKRSGKSSGAANFYADGQRKVCASCQTRSTPYWRDGWGGVCLCNACGIRYKKRRIVCGECSYVPRKEERSGPCPRCGSALVDKP